MPVPQSMFKKIKPRLPLSERLWRMLDWIFTDAPPWFGFPLFPILVGMIIGIIGILFYAGYGP